MTDIDARLRDDVHLLGELLGNTIRDQYGEAFLAKIERIRQGAKDDRRGTTGEELSTILGDLSDEEVLPVARAFNQFLNLANIAEQYELIHRREEGQPEPFEALVLPTLLERLLAEGHSPESLAQQVSTLQIELVLTAHPTEVTRRTLIQKYDAIAAQLAAQDHRDLTRSEKSHIEQRLQRLIAEAWHTEEIRRTRPTPVDEAKWGFAVIEHSLWQAVPNMMRKASEALHAATGQHLPLDAAPIRFASWMGGDRDGNPKTTGSKAASAASKTLQNNSTGANSKTAAGSALSQTNAPKKQTSAPAASAASKVLSDGRTSAQSKTAAGSALSQTKSKK